MYSQDVGFTPFLLIIICGLRSDGIYASKSEGGAAMSTRSRKRRADDVTTLSLEQARESDDYCCSICMELFAEPVELSCTHTFCRACIEAHLGSASECPICRKPAQKVRSAAARFASVAVACSCGKAAPLPEFRQHLDKCKFEAAANVQSATRARSSAMTNAARAATAASSRSASAAVAAAASAASAPNRSTFSCPFCDATHLPREQLVQHLQAEHPDCHGRPAVCPICAAMPWGDPNQVSGNLLQHMVVRHRFDYDSTTDFAQDEESARAPPRTRAAPAARACHARAQVLEEVLRRSMEDK